MNYYSLISEQKFNSKVHHYIGKPPVNEEKSSERAKLPIAGVVIIEFRQGAIYLERYTNDGKWDGDTWHESIDDAKHQAKFEYGDSIIKWIEVPDSEDDPVKYALEAAKKN